MTPRSVRIFKHTQYYINEENDSHMTGLQVSGDMVNKFIHRLDFFLSHILTSFDGPLIFSKWQILMIIKTTNDNDCEYNETEQNTHPFSTFHKLTTHFSDLSRQGKHRQQLP